MGRKVGGEDDLLEMGADRRNPSRWSATERAEIRFGGEEGRREC